MSALILVTLIISGYCSKNPTITLSGLNYSDFDTVINGENVSLYTLSNGDMEVCITNYGGRIVSLMVPDRDGTLRDVVLGHDNIRDYINIDGNLAQLSVDTETVSTMAVLILIRLNTSCLKIIMDIACMEAKKVFIIQYGMRHKFLIRHWC